MILEEHAAIATRSTVSRLEVLSLQDDADRMARAISVQTIESGSELLIHELIELEDGACFDRVQVDDVMLWVGRR